MNGRLEGMETLQNLTLSENELTKGTVKCPLCHKGLLKPFNPKFKVNHCFICDSCGERLTIEKNIVIT